MFSFFLTSTLTGNRYELDFLSGKIDVFHSVFPILALTRTDPNPVRFPCRNLIWAASSSGSVMKYHAALPEYTNSTPKKLNSVPIIFFALVFPPFESWDLPCCEPCDGSPPPVL